MSGESNRLPKLKTGHAYLYRWRRPDGFINEYARDSRGLWWERVPGTDMIWIQGRNQLRDKGRWKLMGDTELRICEDPPEGARLFPRQQAMLPKVISRRMHLPQKMIPQTMDGYFSFEDWWSKHK